VAAREAAPAFARRLGAEAARRDALDAVRWHPRDGTPADLRAVVILGDGAKWIWEHIATLFGTERTEIADWYHPSQHVWTVSLPASGCPARPDRLGCCDLESDFASLLVGDFEQYVSRALGAAYSP